VSHYQGQLYSWDVVNEPVDSKANYSGILKPDIWYPAIPNYVDLAFQWARKADPKAKLILNEVGAEGLGFKSDRVYELVKGMLSRGIPIDGVGLEMHYFTNLYPPPSNVSANIKRLTDLGLEVHITEMDIRFAGNDTEQEHLQQQEQIYTDMLTVCLENPMCKMFLVWGFTDKYSWVGPLQGDIFDINFNPKPAYFGLLKALYMNWNGTTVD